MPVNLFGLPAVPPVDDPSLQEWLHGLRSLLIRWLNLLGNIPGITLGPNATIADYILKSTLSAKGSIIAATAAAIPADIPATTEGFVLTLRAAEAAGVRWEGSVSRVMSWWYMWDARPVVDPNVGVLASQDPLIDNTVDYLGHIVYADVFANAVLSYAHVGFIKPFELDVTQDISAVLLFVLSATAPVGGDTVEIGWALRFTLDNQKPTVGSGDFNGTSTVTVSTHGKEDLVVASLGVVIPAASLLDSELLVSGVFYRDFTDSYLGTVKFLGVKFVGARRLNV